MNRHKHLTDGQIERYTTGSSGQTASREAVEEHIASCDGCRDRVLEHARSHLGFVETIGTEAPTQDCPNEDLLREFAVGLCSRKTSELVMGHVADCKYCAPLLKVYLDAIADSDPMPVPVQRRGRAGFANLLKWFSGLGFGPKLAWAGGLVALIVAGVVQGPVVANQYQLYRADRLVAAAFQESRPNAMRVTWAPYAEVDARRGGKKVSISDLPALAEALAEAARIAGTKRGSSDPKWIEFRARVKLLAGEQDAPQLLSLATEKGLIDANTEIDLAVAYFQDATQTTGDGVGNGNPLKLGESLELLTKVLKQPNLSQDQRAVALFDLAIVYEKMLFWDQAVATWEDYLRLDPVGSWHDEAQRHLDKARSNLQPARPTGYREPGFFLRNSSDSAVVADLEDYQDIAIRSWTLIAVNDPGSEASRAMFKLGQLLERQHGDSWMNDFQRALGPSDSSGVQALGAAVGNNKRGRYMEARQHAEEAADAFLKRKNYPGWLRARLEEIYASQRLLEEPTCLDQAQVLTQELARTRYRWLQIQANLEKAVCRNFAMNFGTALQNLEANATSAADAGFNLLRLRAQALEAAVWVSHDCNATSRQLQAGLELYWQGSNLPLRLYEFYSVAKQCFEKSQLWYASEALERRMITLLENDLDRNDENVLLEITAHRALEQILREEPDIEAAENQARLGLLLLDRVEKVAAKKYEVPIRLELADLQLDRGNPEAAMRTLGDVDPTDDPLIHLGVLRVRGDIQFSNQHLKEAADDYEEALVLAEKALRLLKDEKKRRQWTKETGDVYRGLVAVFLEQKREQEALQLWEWYQARPFAGNIDLEEGAAELRWPDIERAVLMQPLPSTSDTRLVYASGRDHLHIWRIGSTGIKTAQVPEKREDLRRAIFQYLRKCAAPQDSEFPAPVPDEESKRLFSILIQPVLQDLRASDTVIIDMDPALEWVPMESLRSSEGWYFGEKYPTTYSPGYIREAALRRPSSRAPRDGLLLDAWDDKSELNAVIEYFPAMRVVYDEALTKSDLATSLESSEMFIFIGHGESGSLILHNRKSLTAEDFPKESLQSLQVVVLAACSTGVSSEDMLDVRSLVDAFQSGGTPTVIASQWDVDSRATAALMTSFYMYLKNGDSAPRALYQARREIIRNNGHPYYWVGFVLNGRAS